MIFWILIVLHLSYQCDPQKQEDIHEMNIDFPVTVRIYKRIENDNWQL